MTCEQNGINRQVISNAYQILSKRLTMIHPVEDTWLHDDMVLTLSALSAPPFYLIEP